LRTNVSGVKGVLAAHTAKNGSVTIIIDNGNTKVAKAAKGTVVKLFSVYGDYRKRLAGDFSAFVLDDTTYNDVTVLVYAPEA